MADEPSAGGGNRQRDLVVIGASAGGVETLRRVVGNLPPDLPAAICIVLHIAPDSPSLLGSILTRAGPLPCRSAADGDWLRHGEILVAPPDRHLTVEDGRVRLTVGPRENGHRPAVDVLFRTAAEAKGERVIGVILSGTRGDGAVGLAAIVAAGGGTIVQDPSEALYAGMPTSALAHVAVDAIVPSAKVGETIVAMVNGGDPPPETSEPQTSEPQTVAGASGNPGSGDVTICPDCGGVLSELSEAGVPVWECRVGHRYSAEALVDRQSEDVEMALWAAVRALQDRGRLLDRLADQLQGRGYTRTVRSFRRRAGAAHEQATLVREALTRAAELSLRSIGQADGELEQEERAS